MDFIQLIQLIVLQIIVFGGIIFFLKKILYRDTESSINRLDRVYQEMLLKQKELSQKIEAAEKEYGEKKEEAALIVGKMKTDAMDEVRLKSDEVIKKARLEAEEVLKKAHETTEKHFKALEKDFKVQLINQSVLLLGVVFSGKTKELLHHQLFLEFLERAKNFDLSGVGSHIELLTVRSAFVLSKEEQDKVNSMIGVKLTRPIKTEFNVDESLVAGILFQFGTLLLDGSLVNLVREAAEKEKKELSYKE